jgi:hypothetical protein
MGSSAFCVTKRLGLQRGPTRRSPDHKRASRGSQADPGSPRCDPEKGAICRERLSSSLGAPLESQHEVIGLQAGRRPYARTPHQQEGEAQRRTGRFMGSQLRRADEAVKRLLPDASNDSARIDRRPHRTLLAATAVSELKAEPGGELQVHGSGALVRWLLENELVDERGATSSLQDTG